MQEKPLPVILPAVRAFAQLLIFDPQPRLTVTVRDRPVAVSLAWGGGGRLTCWCGLAKRFRTAGRLTQALPSAAPQARLSSPPLPGDSWSLPGSPLASGPLGRLPAQASGECMYPFLCSIIHSHHFACVLIFIKPPSGGKAVLCAGGS